jgi:hypothetical protein
VARDNRRPMRPWVAAVIREFARRSATLDSLPAARRTSLVVQVVDMPSDGWDGATGFVTAAGGARARQEIARPWRRAARTTAR